MCLHHTPLHCIHRRVIIAHKCVTKHLYMITYVLCSVLWNHVLYKYYRVLKARVTRSFYFTKKPKLGSSFPWNPHLACFSPSAISCNLNLCYKKSLFAGFCLLSLSTAPKLQAEVPGSRQSREMSNCTSSGSVLQQQNAKCVSDCLKSEDQLRFDNFGLYPLNQPHLWHCLL